MIVANSSPLIVFGRLERLDILESLFGKIYIPNAVYQETVIETTIDNQRISIQKSITEETIIVVEPSHDHPFHRKLHSGEKGVLNLALEKKANGIIMDDKRARKEAKQLGLNLYYSTPYSEIMELLQRMNIYLPEQTKNSLRGRWHNNRLQAGQQAPVL